MAKWVKCGVETELFDRGVPICPACVDPMEAKRNPPPDGKTAADLLRRKEKQKSL